MSDNEKMLGKNIQELVQNLSNELQKNLGSYGDFFKQSSQVFEELQKEVWALDGPLTEFETKDKKLFGVTEYK